MIVAKGKKVHTLVISKDKPSDDELLHHMLGPTGNLRAPTIRAGKTLIVGFNDNAYRTLFS